MKQARQAVNPQLSAGACWMVAGGCRGCEASCGGRGAGGSGGRWPCRQSAWGQQKLSPSPASQSWFCPAVSTQHLVPWERLISSSTVPREFRASAWGHRWDRANHILLEQSAEERGSETIPWLYEESARVSRGQSWTVAYEPCLIPAEATEPFRSLQYVYNLGFFITQSIPVPCYVR